MKIWEEVTKTDGLLVDVHLSNSFKSEESTSELEAEEAALKDAPWHKR